MRKNRKARLEKQRAEDFIENAYTECLESQPVLKLDTATPTDLIEPFTIGFTGTRHGMTADQEFVITELVLEDGALPGTPSIARHGDCVGADVQFHRICRDAGSIWIVGHPPDNDSQRAFCEFDEIMPPKPYIARNHTIVDNCDVLIAAPHQRKEIRRSGTWATIRYARKQDRQLYIVLPQGKVIQE